MTAPEGRDQLRVPALVEQLVKTADREKQAKEDPVQEKRERTRCRAEAELEQGKERFVIKHSR